MPSAAKAARRKSPLGPLPSWPPNTTFMPVRLAATIMLKPPPATWAKLDAVFSVPGAGKASMR